MKTAPPIPFSMLSAAYFHSEDAAHSFLEAHLWPGGPVCPHCRSTGKKIGKLNGQSTRRGLYKCYACRRPFTVKIGTIFESSHLKLHLWLQAIYLLSCNRRRITLRQLQQTLGIGLKTAWVLSRLIRDLIPRDSESAAVIGEHRSEVAGKTSATAMTMTVTTQRRMKTAAAFTGADAPPRPERPEAGVSKPEAHQEYRKRRARRRPAHQNLKQLTLF